MIYTSPVWGFICKSSAENLSNLQNRNIRTKSKMVADTSFIPPLKAIKVFPPLFERSNHFLKITKKICIIFPI